MSADFTPDSQNKELQDALNLVQFTKQSVFLTGRAGTGKSTFMRYISQHTRKKHIVLAPTGIAAVNAGGVTLHSFFKLPFYPLMPDDPKLSTRQIFDFFKYSKSKRKVLEEVELVIIDEISMVRADTIDAVDRILRIFSHNLRDPFGGKQLLLVGDVFQLEPVVTNDQRAILQRLYPSPYFFSAKVFEQAKLVSVELKKVYRQSDPDFVAVLDRIRTNSLRPADLQLLNTRVKTSPQSAASSGHGAADMYMTLATRRDQVDCINQRRLDNLESEAVTLVGTIKGDFPENCLPTSLELTLKRGAQVIFIRNDLKHRWVNGTIGQVVDIDAELGMLRVLTDDGQKHFLEPEVWRNMRYTYDEEEKTIVEEELGTFTQYPVKLAWAITVHKSQGLTFSRAVIDFTGGVFAAGQTYVALSRCTSLEGMELTQSLTMGDVFVKPDVVHFARNFNSQEALNNALRLAQADVQYRQAVEAFDRGDMDEFLQQFFLAIHSRYDIEKPLVKRYIRRKLSVINKLRNRNQEMQQELAAQRELLSELADEYVTMGRVCITEAHDPKAAMANFDKTLRLCPHHAEALVQRGLLLIDQGRDDEGMDNLHLAVHTNPQSFDAFYTRGRIHLDRHEIEEAVSDLDRATSLRPTHIRAHRLLGDALSLLERFDEAELHFRIAKLLKSKKQEERQKKREGKS